MSPHRTPLIRTHNIIFAPVGSESQTWHFDDSRKKGATKVLLQTFVVLYNIIDYCYSTIGKYHSYFTVLIHLNSIDDLCGGTEIWSQSLKRGDLVSFLFVLWLLFLCCYYISFDIFILFFRQIRGRPGDAFVFNGSLLHRGQGNRGFTHRWFYYASFSCTKDANEVRL